MELLQSGLVLKRWERPETKWRIYIIPLDIMRAFSTVGPGIVLYMFVQTWYSDSIQAWYSTSLTAQIEYCGSVHFLIKWRPAGTCCFFKGTFLAVQGTLKIGISAKKWHVAFPGHESPSKDSLPWNPSNITAALYRGVWGGRVIGSPSMPRGASLSDGFAPDCCRNSILGSLLCTFFVDIFFFFTFWLLFSCKIYYDVHISMPPLNIIEGLYLEFSCPHGYRHWRGNDATLFLLFC